jgi:hypothetical protein
MCELEQLRNSIGVEEIVDVHLPSHGRRLQSYADPSG